MIGMKDHKPEFNASRNHNAAITDLHSFQMLNARPHATHDALGAPCSPGLAAQIAALSYSPLAASAAAWYWQRAGCHAQALALLEAGGVNRVAPRLRSLFALELHKSFLDALGSRRPRGWLVPARGLARLALGAPDDAVADLDEAVAMTPQWGLWLRAACALAIIDRARALSRLEPRRAEPLVALLLAHLAAQGGDTGKAAGLLKGRRFDAARTAEYELLLANLARGEADNAAAKDAESRAFAHYGLRHFDEPAPPAGPGGPLVSIIVAAYNAEQTIDAALQSLLRQSWRNLKILVVDDASSDATAACAQAWAGRHEAVRVLRLEKNVGAYRARNAGLAAASGEFVSFHDADDIAHPERIARQLAPLLADAQLAFTLSRWVRRTADGHFRSRQIVPLVRLHIGSVLVRRAFLDVTVPQFDPVRFGADNDLLLQLQVAAGPGGFAVLDKPLTIGGYMAHSAVHDALTGYGDKGYSLERQAYREARTLQLVGQLARY